MMTLVNELNLSKLPASTASCLMFIVTIDVRLLIDDELLSGIFAK